MSSHSGRIGSVKNELVKKSREAMLSAVQIYNNPLITFKSETFIVLAIVAWTYLLHAHLRSKKIDYAYSRMQGTRKRYDKTPFGLKKYWSLSDCINKSFVEIDRGVVENLNFLIGIRHEIEHRMSIRIDSEISAKLQACAINYSEYVERWFGVRNGVSSKLAMSIQFSEISPRQAEQLRGNSGLSTEIQNFIATFEDKLPEDIISNSKYAYRVAFIQLNMQRKGQADSVIEFVKPGSEIASKVNQVLLKETEKEKYLPSKIVEIMQKKGFYNFKIVDHTNLWKQKSAKDPGKGYGVTIANTWYWYKTWVSEVEEYCKKNLRKFGGDDAKS